MDTAIVGVLATILGALVGAWIAYHFSLELAKRQMFNQAAMQFRAAFTDELTKLTTGSDEPYDVLKNAEVRHVSAGFEFRRILTEKERERFDQAWQRYYCADQDPRQPYLEKYSEHLSDEQSGIPKRERRRTAIDRIEAILRLAQMK